MKPILFNTEMVQAILDGRKTVTRRLIKPRYRDWAHETGFQIVTNAHTGEFIRVEIVDEWESCTRVQQPPCWPGDVLYVRETWRVNSASNPPRRCTIGYKAGGDATFDDIIALPTTKGEWKPSIHMPKEAARIFLRVKRVSVERLMDITPEEAIKEGCTGVPCDCSNTFVAGGALCCADCNNTGWREPPTLEFMALWDSTIKPADLPTYGWNVNPWVWVIEFEKISKEEATKC